MPESDHDGPGQRCQINHQVGRETAGIDERISENKAPLGIRILDFGGHTVQMLENVSRFKGAAPREVLCCRNQPYQAHRQIQCRGNLDCAQHARAGGCG